MEKTLRFQRDSKSELLVFNANTLLTKPLITTVSELEYCCNLDKKCYQRMSCIFVISVSIVVIDLILNIIGTILTKLEKNQQGDCEHTDQRYNLNE